MGDTNPAAAVPAVPALHTTTSTVTTQSVIRFMAEFPSEWLQMLESGLVTGGKLKLLVTNGRIRAIPIAQFEDMTQALQNQVLAEELHIFYILQLCTGPAVINGKTVKQLASLPKT